MINNISLAIHGGAGTINKNTLSPTIEIAYKNALNLALKEGYQILKAGGTSIDAVQGAVVSLENCELFNAGKGSVFSASGKNEMDAAIMEGEYLRAGAVASIQNIKNPIKLARAIMEQSEHVFMVADGAIEFAKAKNLDFENDDYFYVQQRFEQWQSIKDSDQYNLDHVAAPSSKKFGTVGAVAIDINGNLAAATSTGGMTNKKFGRVGDSPIIGAGTYANNYTCAISCTGHGELFIRALVAYDISCLMEYKNYSLKQACDYVVYEKLVKIKGEGGLIAIDKFGNIELPFNSEGMYRGSINPNGEIFISIYK